MGDWLRERLKLTCTHQNRPKQRYVLTRHELPQATSKAATVTYGWTGIDCATHESRNTGYYEATALGEISKVTGRPPAWEKFGPTSVSQNVYVLLCER